MAVQCKVLICVSFLTLIKHGEYCDIYTQRLMFVSSPKTTFAHVRADQLKLEVLIQRYLLPDWNLKACNGDVLQCKSDLFNRKQ